VLVGEAVVEADGEKQSAFAMKEYSSDNEEELIDEIATKVVGDALDKIGAGKVKSGKYNVVIDSKQMRSLLSVYSGSFSAKSVIDKMSRLEGKLGEVVAAPIVTLTDDPQREGSCAGTTFDAEGVATYKKCVIEGGVLKTYLHNRETAKKMGVTTTANASKGAYHSPISIMPYAFSMSAGDKTLDELFAMAGEGVYVTSLSGLHAGANGVTGDFSLQAQGFLIKDGKRAGAVKGFTLAGNFFEMLKQITALSDTVDMGTQTSITAFGAPSALVPLMSIAGE
jgi:PmbA protein